VRRLVAHRNGNIPHLPQISWQKLWIDDDRAALVLHIYSIFQEMASPTSTSWGFIIRFFRFIVAYSIYLGLWISYFYFNAIIEICPGQYVSVKAAFNYFLQSQWWANFKLALGEIFEYGNSYGWLMIFEYDEGFGLVRAKDDQQYMEQLLNIEGDVCNAFSSNYLWCNSSNLTKY